MAEEESFQPSFPCWTCCDKQSRYYLVRSRNAATFRSPCVGTSANSISTDRSLANFRSLFARYSAPPSSPAASLGQARVSSAPPPKRKKTSVPFVVKETWTHEVFWLADHLQNKLPSRTEKFQLQEVRLGRKSVVFHRKDQALAFVEKLESVYPKLKEAGGFEILRSQVVHPIRTSL